MLDFSELLKENIAAWIKALRLGATFELQENTLRVCQVSFDRIVTGGCCSPKCVDSPDTLEGYPRLHDHQNKGDGRLNFR